MNPQTIMAIGYLFSSLLEAGLTISEVMQEVKATGVVPEAEWDRLEQDIDSGIRFWSD